MSTTEHEGLTVDELRDELRDRDLKVSGTKDELLARLEADQRGDDGEPDPSDAASTPRLRDVVEQIRDDLSDVLGLPVERVTGLARSEEGWRAQVDVVEVSRIPPSTDVLASYEVGADRSGRLGSFERVRRFLRSEGSDR